MNKELSEFWKRINPVARRIEILTKHPVRSFFPGSHSSKTKGGGIEFLEHKLYEPGDEKTFIDERASERGQKLVIIKHKEEKELTVTLLCDLSSSMEFGDVEAKKITLIDICAALGFLAIKNGDEVGLIGFSDRIKVDLSPTRARSRFIGTLKEIWVSSLVSQGTNISQALEYLCLRRKRPSLVFLISDFVSKDDFSGALRVVAQKHDLIPIIIEDERERELPNVGLIRTRNIENQREVLLDTSSRKFRESFKEMIEKNRKERISLFRKLDLDWLTVLPRTDYLKELVILLLGRRNK